MPNNPPDVTQIPAPRVDFIDKRTGLMAREWYRFFVNLYDIAGGGASSVSLDDLQLGPSSGASTDDFAEMQKTLQELELQPPVTPGILAYTATSLANPTALVGSTTINGSAVTAMRSDAAPAIDLTANYTYTGQWTFSRASTTSALNIYANATNWQCVLGFAGTAEFKIDIASSATGLGVYVTGTKYLAVTAGNVSVPAGTFSVNGATIQASTGSPNGVVTGNPGDLYLNKSGGAGTTLYVKESGSATNTGWVAK